MNRTLVFGNSGAGKSTYARRLTDASGAAHLDLDSIAWLGGHDAPRRRPLAESAALIEDFLDQHPSWVIEGCYADLLALVAGRATAMVFLNPGVATCIDNARRRPWEPHKYPSKADQDANLDRLIAWISDYAERDDTFSLRAHRELFDAFPGSKRELRSNHQDE